MCVKIYDIRTGTNLICQTSHDDLLDGLRLSLKGYIIN